MTIKPYSSRLIFLGMMTIIVFSLNASQSIGDKNHYAMPSLITNKPVIKLASISNQLNPIILSTLTMKSNASILAINVDKSLLENNNKKITFVNINSLQTAVSHAPFDILILIMPTESDLLLQILSPEYLSHLRELLKSQGRIFFQVLASPMQNDPLSEYVDNHLRSVFPNCMVSFSTYSSQFVPMTYICQKSLQEKDDIIYTDDNNAVTLDYFNQDRA